MDYYSAVKRDTALTKAAMWGNPGYVTLRERIQTHKNRVFYPSLSVKGPELGKLCSAFLFSWQVEVTIAAQYVVVKFETDVGMVAGSGCLLNVTQGGRKRDIQYFYFGIWERHERGLFSVPVVFRRSSPVSLIRSTIMNGFKLARVSDESYSPAS